jgi:hypothetical protein
VASAALKARASPSSRPRRRQDHELDQHRRRGVGQYMSADVSEAENTVEAGRLAGDTASRPISKRSLLLR